MQQTRGVIKDQECAWWSRQNGTEIQTRSWGCAREGANVDRSLDGHGPTT